MAESLSVPQEAPDSRCDRLSPTLPRNWVLLGGVGRECARWPEAPQVLLQQLRRLEPASQLRLLDLPGTGRRWQERSPSHAGELVDGLRERVQNLEGPIGLVTSSVGAALATEWARRHPQDLAALVLVSPVLRPFTPLLRAVRPSLWPTLAALLMGRRSPWALDERLFASTTNLRADVIGLDSEWRRLRDEHPVKLRNVWAQGLAVWRYEASRRRPHGRVLLLAGRADQWFDWRISQAISRAWGAALRVHPEAGHDLLLDDPDWVARSLAEWLQPVGQAG
ncbi:alpha/beta fold hydrolase [Inhella sp.]|uniref:alpha/beta fold hydrolase n=1 Tax=Inhella sp. TaxID=1921806 RepID=UPI0035ADFFDF